MRIFLIAGNAGSGKGEVAKIIKEFYIYRHEQSAITEYGKYLKVFAKELTDWDGNPLTKPRKYLQEFGHKVREINPTYLTKNMMQDFEIYNAYVQNVIVSDVRMPDEIDAIKNAYDEVYSIYVENQFSASKLSVEEQIDITEIALESYQDFDYTIANEEGIDKLKAKVFSILEGIK